MIRVGVIGAGAMGQHHVRIYNEMENVELVGIADVDSKRINKLASIYNTTPYVEYQKLLEQDLDAVSVVVPTTLHNTVVMDAINAGCHVLVEKPITDSLENGATMIKAAKDANLKLMVGHIERFNPAVIKLKEIIDSGLLGKIVSISARRVGPYNPRIRDVGIIMDLGVHDVDVISYLYGKPVDKVYTIAGKDIHTFEDHASIMLRFDNELSGIIETNWLTPHKVRNLTVIGLEGVAYLDYLKQTVELHDEGWIRTAKVQEDEPLKIELRHFIDSIKENKTHISSGEDGLHALGVAMAAIESYKSGNIVEMNGYK